MVHLSWLLLENELNDFYREYFCIPNSETILFGLSILWEGGEVFHGSLESEYWGTRSKFGAPNFMGERILPDLPKEKALHILPTPT